jgi:hypothetical protein
VSDGQRDDSPPVHAGTDESTGGFEMFRARAKSAHGFSDPVWRVGFEPEYRVGAEAAIADAIFSVFVQQANPGVKGFRTLVDIGGGASSLTDCLSDLCCTHGMRHLVVDSPEMLAHLAPHPCRSEVAGRFPDVLADLLVLAKGPKAVLAYSVLQYVFRDMAATVFLDGIVSLLQPGDAALVGDIPNRDKRDRQYLANGQSISVEQAAEIRDRYLIRELSRLRRRGLHVYLIPQSSREPMHRHRENLLIVSPAPARPLSTSREGAS